MGSYFSSLMSNSKEMLFENFKLNYDCLCLAAEKISLVIRLLL